MANVSLVEIFNRVKREPNKDKKLSILKRFNSVALRTYIDLMFNPKVKLNLPDGEYPINEETLVGPPTNRLETIYRSLPAFANKRAKQVNLERGWFNVISALSKKEREFLEAAKDKKVDLGLTYKELRGVFPHLPDVSDDVLSETFRYVPGVTGKASRSVLPTVNDVQEEEEQQPKKRGPGRPRGSKNKKKKQRKEIETDTNVVMPSSELNKEAPASLADPFSVDEMVREATMEVDKDEEK